MDATSIQDDYHYPESDGRPMAESSFHWHVMVDTTQALRRWYKDKTDVWVGSNLFLYYKRRTPGIAPDVFAVRGVSKKDRRAFKVWEEGGNAPFFVLEVTSLETQEEDQDKKEIYQAMGVEEYFLFDPLEESLSPCLQGFRLTESGYESIPYAADETLYSTTTGLLFRPEGVKLRLVVGEGAPLPWSDEIYAAWKAETAARQAAEERARALEAELARLRGERG